MSKYWLIPLLFLFCNTYAQKGFYVRPAIERKFHANKGLTIPITTQNDYTLIVKPKRFYTAPGFNLGLNAGYRTKNWFAEIGWAQDEANSGIDLILTDYRKYNNTYYSSRMLDAGGQSYSRFGIKFGIKLFGNDSVALHKKYRWQGFLFGGLEFLIRPPIPAETGLGFVYYTNANLDSMLYSSYFSSGIRYGFMGTLGFMLKGYNKKGRNMINFSVHFSQARRYNQLSYQKINFYDYKDGSNYETYTFSKGSGLYFTISKDIFIPTKWQRMQKASKHLDYKK
jgi:hypothetical protein